MAYIAKTHLPYKGKFIKPGEKVPEDYKRLHDGIKRGWIEVTADPAAASPPVMAPLPIVDSTAIAPEEPPVYVEPAIEDLDYLMPMAKDSLAEKGVVAIRDLEGWDVEALDELRGIGVKLAERLLADFAEYAEWKESFREYQEVPIDMMIGALPPEDEDAESEPGEDEGPQDD